MFKNYLVTALRNIKRHKGFSFINILSLAIGLAGCLVIGLFVWDELKYDRFVKDGDDIYRFYTKRTEESGTTSTASVPPMFATYAQQQFPEVETTTRLLMYGGNILFEANGKKAYEEKGLIADSTFFRVFPLPFIHGDAVTALNDPTSIVLTRNLARKYFGDANPVGQTIKIDKTDFAVKGVLADVPEHFHLDLSYVLPISGAGLPAERMKSWGWQQFFTYIKVKPGTNAEALESKLQSGIEKELETEENRGGTSYMPYLQQLKDIHLKSSQFIYDNSKRGNYNYVRGLAIIAIFVLIIACFNFINLATARSFRRAKEIGVRKVAGADRKQLMLQFTGETILLSLGSLIIAVFLTLLLLPYLNRFTGKQISFDLFLNPLYLLVLLLAGVFIGALAGIYPALVMSGFKPISVLKGLKPTGTGNRSSALREGLVVIQFALSVLLIVCTTIVYRQMTFLHDKDLGFNKDQVIYFSAQGDVKTKPEAFKAELLRFPGIISATAGYGLPGDQLAGDGVKIPGKDGDKDQPTILFVVDHDYVKTMGVEIVAGRNFSKDFPTDIEEAFIINETAVKEFGFGSNENALGKVMKWDKWIPDSVRPVKIGKVIGIVKDFHYKSLHEKLNPAVLQIYPPEVVKVAVKVKAADIDNTISFIHSVWNKFSPDYPLAYNFLDENFQKMYKAEEKLSSLLWIFTGLAIFVGCLGLFGLAAFSAEQRVKEIGIRKVLGASVLSIMTLLSGKFLRPVFFASLIGFPLAWWAMRQWLQDFPYRVSISWWVFLVAGIAALVIALLTVSFQALRAAVANPVKSLRTE